MSKAEEALQAVRDFAARAKLNKWDLAEEAGLHRNTLRDMDKEDWNPRTDTLKKLEAYMENRG